MSQSQELVSLFESVGLSTLKATETANNKKLSLLFRNAIVGTTTPANEPSGSIIDRQAGALLYYLAANIRGNAVHHLNYLSDAIKQKRLLSSDQVAAGIKYIHSNHPEQTVDALFNEHCGVGIIISKDQISKTITKLLEEKREELMEKRYQLLGPMLLAIKNDLKWANGLELKEELDKQLFVTLGPKGDTTVKPINDNKPKTNLVKESTVNEVVKIETIAERSKTTKLFFEGEMAKLHKPGQNPQINDVIMVNHLKRTKGQMITRFPPEPNGFLHIGHAKAININFGYAAANNGITYLRYDDTNPEAEEDIYFKSILDSVAWLGFTPDAIKYSSDYFQRLYELAVELIKIDKAYICHHSAEEMKMMRGGDDNKGPRLDSKWRNRPIHESLVEFQKMKDGKYEEGVTTLRMKMDMQHDNPQFWDLVAYRVLYTPHVRTGKQWCIYPTYDYTHCLCDSFEDITHSLCTTEFVMSRESYYWLCDALEQYKPVQWEYGRLKLTNTVLSKRKLMKLVDLKLVNGWDDPRLFTLEALRRRGFTPNAINAFVRELGVTTSNSTIPLDRLERYVRDDLNESASRLMVLLEPLKVTLTNLKDDFLQMIDIPNHPQDPSFGSREIAFTKTLYIDQCDFREEIDPNFYRLSIGKTCGLLNIPFPITATKMIRNEGGKVIEIEAVHENTSDEKKKCKSYIQWVGESKIFNSPVIVKVRVYDNLFMHSDPDNKEQVPGGWLSDVNPDSLKVYENAFADTGVLKSRVEEKYQFLRLGYFCVDKESDYERGAIVFNKTTGLKEDSKKDR